MHSAISSEIITEQVEKREVKFEVISTSPIKAYIRKDIVSSTRDIQSFMFVFFPLFYPLIMIFSMIGLFSELTFSIEVIMTTWSILLIFYWIIPIMLVVGFFNIEESGSSTTASLPIVPRDQAKAKLILMSIIQGLSLTLASIVLTFLINSFIVLVLLLISLPIAWTFLLLIFVLKIKFFGQMKYKFVIEEVNKRNKPLKWIVMVLSEFGLYLVIVITGGILIFIFDILIALIVLGVIGLLGLSIVIFSFVRMFPKAEKMAEYKTGGFLRKHVNVATLVLLILYFIFLIPLPNLIMSIILLFLPILPNIWITIIGFIIMTMARVYFPRMGTATLIAAFAMLYKFLNVPFYGCHLLGILMTGICYDLFFSVLKLKNRSISAAAAVYLSYASFAVMIIYIFRYEHWVQGGFIKVLQHIVISGTITAIACADLMPISFHLGGKLKSLFSMPFNLRPRLLTGSVFAATTGLWTFGIAVYIF